ncbi:YcjF family protein [Saccharospirillum impatiens]|uniref:YcjF family protein n=1 Tax=Saccharospirillum impatiens TaxID=169438 RepID=UPI00040C6C7F|nr:GTPase [Saccharospirillum impatiens]
MASEPRGKNWKRIVNAVLSPQPGVSERVAPTTPAAVPVLWLLGKVQSGKTSIVHAITRHPEAEIGAGFKPCTRHAQSFDFPAELPLVRFIDTRGLGEVGYSPEDDLVAQEHQADALIVVARAMDPQQDEVFEQVTRIRKHHPNWPLVLVQTRLHDAYPDDRDHPAYVELHRDTDLVDLQRALMTQAARLDNVPGDGPVHAVAVDLTPPEDGFSDPDYGLEALLSALDEVLDSAHSEQLRSLQSSDADDRLRQVHPHLMGYATAAGLTDLIPLAGFVTVPTLQGKMLHSIGRIYGLDWDRRSLAEFGTSLGSGTLVGIGASFAARQLGKLVPVYGQSVGAVAAGTASAAVTYALGRAACYYLKQSAMGKSDPTGVANAYRGSLQEAYRLFHDRMRREHHDRET